MSNRWKTTAPVLLLLLSLAGLAPAQALEIHEMHPSGQAPIVTAAEIDGRQVGLVLVIDRGVEELPRSALGIYPSEDPSEWRAIDLPNAPGAVAAGDIDGDGDDEVAITIHFEGETCPSETLGQTPCGVVRILDGKALLRGEAEEVGRVRITPQTTGTCSPSSHPPSSLSLADVTGDGRAELALGQLGLEAGSCGVVHVITGDRLQGETDLGAACARVEGDAVREDRPPDQFGMVTDLYTTGPGTRGVLGLGVPYAGSDDGTPLAGRVTLHDLSGVCPGNGVAPAVPPVLAQRHGSVQGQQFGVGMAHVEDLLWVSGKGGVTALDPGSLEERHSYPTAMSIPVSKAPDLTGDGQAEVMVGTWVMTAEGQVVMAFNQFAEDNFRGTVLSKDHALASGKFGTLIWSLTDLWRPFVALTAEPARAVVGDVVRVSVDKVIALMPTEGDASWSIYGGSVVDQDANWIDVKADGSGNMVVQFKVGDKTTLVRVPVEAAEEKASLSGPSTVRALQPFTLRVAAPEDATVSWQAPDASPPSGTGRTVETQYESSGVHPVTVDVVFASGNTTTLSRDIEVTEGDVDVLVPDSIPQGQSLELTVADPEPTLSYAWHVEGAGIGPLTTTAPSMSVPATGWGPVQVTVVAHTDAGETVGVGHATVEVENLPPEFQSFVVRSDGIVDGLQVDAVASDPGGDPVTVAWYLDGEAAGEGGRLSAPDLEAGDVVLTAVATDAAGLETTLTRTVFVADSGWRTSDEGPEGSGPDDGPAGDVLPSDSDDRLLPGPAAVPFIALLLAAAVAARRRSDR